MKTYKVEFTVNNIWMSAKIVTAGPLSTKKIRARLASFGFNNVCLHYISGLA